MIYCYQLIVLKINQTCIVSFSCKAISVEYRLVRKLGEGTFSEVLKAESVNSRQKVAIKCMKSHFDNIEQVRQPLKV